MHIINPYATIEETGTIEFDFVHNDYGMIRNSSTTDVDYIKAYFTVHMFDVEADFRIKASLGHCDIESLFAGNILAISLPPSPKPKTTAKLLPNM